MPQAPSVTVTNPTPATARKRTNEIAAVLSRVPGGHHGDSRRIKNATVHKAYAQPGSEDTVVTTLQTLGWAGMGVVVTAKTHQLYAGQQWTVIEVSVPDTDENGVPLRTFTSSWVEQPAEDEALKISTDGRVAVLSPDAIPAPPDRSVYRVEFINDASQGDILTASPLVVSCATPEQLLDAIKRHVYDPERPWSAYVTPYFDAEDPDFDNGPVLGVVSLGADEGVNAFKVTKQSAVEISIPEADRRYCLNCWESLQEDGTHRPEQVCTNPSEPVTEDQLGVAVHTEMHAIHADPTQSADALLAKAQAAVGVSNGVDQPCAPAPESESRTYCVLFNQDEALTGVQPFVATVASETELCTAIARYVRDGFYGSDDAVTAELTDRFHDDAINGRVRLGDHEVITTFTAIAQQYDDKLVGTQVVVYCDGEPSHVIGTVLGTYYAGHSTSFAVVQCEDGETRNVHVSDVEPLQAVKDRRLSMLLDVIAEPPVTMLNVSDSIVLGHAARVLCPNDNDDATAPLTALVRLERLIERGKFAEDVVGIASAARDRLAELLTAYEQAHPMGDERLSEMDMVYRYTMILPGTFEREVLTVTKVNDDGTVNVRAAGGSSFRAEPSQFAGRWPFGVQHVDV